MTSGGGHSVPKIEVHGLHKSFGPKAVLLGVDLEIAVGESLVVIGGSGTGKSVMIKCILGLLRPENGSIKIDVLVCICCAIVLWKCPWFSPNVLKAAPSGMHCTRLSGCIREPRRRRAALRVPADVGLNRFLSCVLLVYGLMTRIAPKYDNANGL